MDDVREQYADLRETMSTFQVSVSECLSKAEAEFLQAYRAHMVEVHRELQGLRDKLSEAESSILKDDHIQQLERDGAWYRNEAAQQTAYIAAMDKDRAYMRRKYSTLEADRRWLSRQLKASKKQQKLLQAELKARNLIEEAAPASASGTSSRDGGGGRRGTRMGRREAEHLPKSQSLTVLDRFGRSSSTVHRKSAPDLAWMSGLAGAHGGDAASAGNRSHGGHSMAASLRSADAGRPMGADARLGAEVRALRKELEAESQSAGKLRGVLVAERSRMADYRDFYAACVADLETHNAKRTVTSTHAVLPDTFALLGELMFPDRDDPPPDDAPPLPFDARRAPSPAARTGRGSRDSSSLPAVDGAIDSRTSLGLDGDTLDYLKALGTGRL